MKTLKTEAARLRDQVIASTASRLDELAKKCESPAEEALFWALLGDLDGLLIEPGGASFGVIAPGLLDHGDVLRGETSGGSGRVKLLPQAKVKAGERCYRLDFGLVAMFYWEHDRTVLVDIEVDGHNFHERTPEQAERDKQRDRDLQSIGWRVARFTASEVLRSPETVARKIDDFVSDVWISLKRSVRQGGPAGAPPPSNQPLN